MGFETPRAYGGRSHKIGRDLDRRADPASRAGTVLPVPAVLTT
ncbi:hypothetical protein [Nocardia wallacei]|nr:hypothetical protein [Nocardia wallacei]